MHFHKKFWTVTIEIPPHLASFFADALGDSALAVTVLAPPRRTSAHIELLYDQPPNKGALDAQASVLAMIHGIKAPFLKINALPKLDWLKKVTEDFPPLPIAWWTIHGAQHKKSVADRRRALQIDATNAFGTGEHPTTRGCLLTLSNILKRYPSMKSMLDLGCGSGVLAMAFCKKTHQKAIAVDLDPLSVMIAHQNSHINGLGRNICVGLSRGYNNPILKRGAPYDLVMSNIFAVPLAHMARDLKNYLKPGGIAILAGLLKTQTNLVISSHKIQGIHLIKRMNIGEWSILVLRRTKRA